MVRLKIWQWVILGLPIASVIGFLLLAAGVQIHNWGINWIWAIFTIVLVGWRWLLVRWTKPAFSEIETAIAQVSAELESTATETPSGVGKGESATQVETALKEILQTSQNNPPIWEDWQAFWQQCQQVVVAVAQAYHPEVRYPLLNIYIPQAYGLMRGTVDDLDRWMQQLSPALNQVTVGQAYQAYEVYRKLEPSARKLWRVWNWAQWALNPAVAAARVASQQSNNQATQQLLVNLSQLLREAALRNLARQAIALYSGTLPPGVELKTQTPKLPQAQTQTLRDLLSSAEPPEVVAQKPVSILLVGRTGAGKSSLINTLFQAERAEVDVLPSTDRIQNYHWETSTGETLTLWDTPGYEQVNREDLRELVLDYGKNADLLLLVTPALDPALQMDVDFLNEIKTGYEDCPAIAIVTQVDRLRPIREWEPPYNWQWGDRPKEKAIREATEYRSELLGEYCDRVLPIVTRDSQTGRQEWGIDLLSMSLVEAIAPAQKLRLARFLRDLDARTLASAQIIDRFTFQMATAQGLATLLKSPVLQFISTVSTGSPKLAYLLSEQIPVEQLPVVIGKLQMAYELFSLLSSASDSQRNFDLLALWPLLLENPTPPERNAWAFGHALVEYWTKNLTISQVQARFEEYLQQQP